MGGGGGIQAGSSATKALGGGGVRFGLVRDLEDDLGGGGGGGSDICAGTTEYRSIWPRGAAEAVIDSFSKSRSGSLVGLGIAGILGTGGGVSTPQLTGLRLISVVSESLAVAGAKKL